MIKRSILLGLLCGVVLNGCTTTPTEPYVPLAEMTYEHLVEIPVRTRVLDVIVETQRGAKPWDIANELPTPPDIAVRRYIDERFKAKGGKGIVTVNIKTATVALKSVPQDNFVLKHIPIANNDEYTFEIEIDIAARYISGQPDRESTLRFVRQVDIPPQVTPVYREARLQRVLEQVIRDIDEAMIRELDQEFSIIRRADIPVRAIEVQTEEPELKFDLIEPTIFNGDNEDQS